MVIGGILAGGLGKRMAESMGMDLPKQFLKIGGVPIMIRTIRKFYQSELIDRVVVAMNEDWIDYCKELLKEYGMDDERIIVIPGGKERFDSLVCLAEEADRISGGAEDTLLINHDCARPFVNDRIIRDNIEIVKNYDMVTTSVPTVDTVLIAEDQKECTSVPYRPTVFLDQGPQTVNVKHFLNLVATLSDEERKRYMEAGRLYTEKGFHEGIVVGARENFKITTQLDLMLAEVMVKDNPDL